MSVLNRKKLTKAESEKLAKLEKKAIGTYTGFNLCRRWFAEKDDADKFLELKIKQDPSTATYLSYGAECRSSVEKVIYREKDAWEVVYG